MLSRHRIRSASMEEKTNLSIPTSPRATNRRGSAEPDTAGPPLMRARRCRKFASSRGIVSVNVTAGDATLAIATVPVARRQDARLHGDGRAEIPDVARNTVDIGAPPVGRGEHGQGRSRRLGRDRGPDPV